MGLDPFPGLSKVLLLNVYNGSVGCWPNIEQEIAVFANNVNKTRDNGARIHVACQWGGAIVSVAVWIHSKVTLPFTSLHSGVCGVFWRIKVPWEATSGVHDNLPVFFCGLVEPF